jgi:hypothetical protein
MQRFATQNRDRMPPQYALFGAAGAIANRVAQALRVEGVPYHQLGITGGTPR